MVLQRKRNRGEWEIDGGGFVAELEGREGGRERDTWERGGMFVY